MIFGDGGNGMTLSGVYLAYRSFLNCHSHFIVSRGEIRASLPSLFQDKNPELLSETDDGDEDYEDSFELCKECGNLFYFNQLYKLLESNEFICIFCFKSSDYRLGSS